MNVTERIEDYKENHCWQFDIRIKNLEQDCFYSGLSLEETKQLKISDFILSFEEKTIIWEEAKTFIERHEWLGKMSLYPTHIFTARYKGILAGVVVMDMPNAFSKLVGENTRKIERLISRGACISWSPKNLASTLIMFSIRWMVANTRFRVFTAYSDSEAKELGTIYQACNFIYLGKTSGTKRQYKVPGASSWISDRSFRTRSYYKRYAQELKIPWQKEWNENDKIIWTAMPKEIELALKAKAREWQSKSEVREVSTKHKYVYLLGNNKKETKELHKLFIEKNPALLNLPYPKIRGE